MINVNCHTYVIKHITVGMKIAFMTTILLVKEVYPPSKTTKTMRRIYHSIVLGVCMCLAASINAQDIHFSQFYMSPLNLNPAMTGAFNCDHRMIVNYRNQWAGVLGANAYNTGSASYDRRMPVGREDYFGAGISLYSDVAGSTRFGTSQAKVSFAYTRKLGGRRNISHTLSFGVDGGITQRRVQLGELQWPTQVSNGVFDPSRPGEVIPNPDFLYADLAAGLMWNSVFGPRKFISGGVAMHHLNQANVSFLGRQESLLSRLTVHVGGEYPLNNKVSLRPDLIYLSQGPHKQINAGTSIKFVMGPVSRNPSNAPDTPQSFQIGAWYRLGNQVDGGIHSDAIILVSRIEFDQGYSIGFSYDYNVSQLSAAAAGNGSFELSFQYLICNGGSRGVLCPSF